MSSRQNLNNRDDNVNDMRKYELSIGQKIALIPIIGLLGFALNFFYAALINVESTDRLRAIQSEAFPLVEMLYRIRLNQQAIKHTLLRQQHETTSTGTVDLETRHLETRHLETTHPDTTPPETALSENREFEERLAQTLDSIASHYPQLLSYVQDTREAFDHQIQLLRAPYASEATAEPHDHWRKAYSQADAGFEQAYIRLDTEARTIFLDSLREAKESSHTFFTVSVVIFATMGITFILASAVISRAILHTFLSIKTLSQSIARGKMDTPVPELTGRESAEVLEAIIAMRDKINSANIQINFKAEISTSLTGQNYNTAYNTVLKLLRTYCKLSSCMLYIKHVDKLRCVHYSFNKASPLPADLVNNNPTATDAFQTKQIQTQKIETETGMQMLSTSWPVIYQGDIVGVLFAAHDEELDDEAIALLFYTLNRISIYMNEYLMTQQRDQLIRHLENTTHEMIKKNEEITKISRAKSDFLANMSHELRTPLNVIIGFSQRILRNQNDLPERLVKSIEAIKNNGENLSHTVNNLLSLASLQANMDEANLSHLIPGELLESLLSEMTAKAEKKNLSLSLTTTNLPKAIESDRDKLQHILWSITDNAIKYSDSGHVNIQADYNNETLYLSVSDQGRGIPAEKLETLFDQFQRLNNRYEGQVGLSGSGLSLSLVKQYIDTLGGSITCESTEGKGTKVDIVLPTKQVQVNAPAA